MSKIKKILAGALAAVSVMSSAMCLGASAYEDRGSWDCYVNNYTNHSVVNFSLNYYSAGYRAVCTGKTNGGSYNYVDVYDGSIKRTTLTEVGVICQPFEGTMHIDSNKKRYAMFTIKLKVEDTSASNTPHNYGDIRLSNQY